MNSLPPLLFNNIPDNPHAIIDVIELN